MGCHGSFSIDEATRRLWYSPEAILKDLNAGMVFADIGCGDGFFTVFAAKKVGATGKVFAVDVDASAIEKLKQKAEHEGLRNINAKVGAAEETVFCTGCSDFIFYSMVLHDFANPAKVLQNARRMLKPSGRLVNLDWKKEEMSFGPPLKIRFSQEKAAALISDAGFQIIHVMDAGKYHYFVSAQPLP
jgi:ubiquinone/menaquinone biosynthesis C-methylase UbiE